MIKLACNYYCETEELVMDNKIEIDYFKFPSLGFQMNILKDYGLKEFERSIKEIRKIKPVLYHGLMPSPCNVCSPNFKDELRIDIIQRIVDMTGTPGISLHLDGDDAMVSQDELIRIVVDNVVFLKSQFPGLKFISLENAEKSKSMHVANPDVISEIIRQADVNFLLDISHAFWTANYVGENLLEYLHKLPLEKIYEIHINGWEEKDGDIMSHIKINEMGYRLLEHILDYSEPKIVTLEYGRSNDRIGIGCPILSPDSVSNEAKDEISEQILRLRDIISLK